MDKSTQFFENCVYTCEQVAEDSNSVTITLPIAYTKNVYSIVASCGTANTPIAVTRAGSLTTITLYTPSPLDGATINWLTVGY